MDKILIQKAKSLARGINSINEPDAKFVVEIIITKITPFLSGSGLVDEHVLEEGGKEEHFFA